MKKILIIDDEKIARSGLSEIIVASGFSVAEASNETDGLNIFKKEGISAILLDLKIPGMEGVETMKELKKVDPDVPIIIVSADREAYCVRDLKKLGANGFFSKPPDFEKLINTLKTLVEKSGKKPPNKNFCRSPLTKCGDIPLQ